MKWRISTKLPMMRTHDLGSSPCGRIMPGSEFAAFQATGVPMQAVKALIAKNPGETTVCSYLARGDHMPRSAVFEVSNKPKAHAAALEKGG